MSRIQNRRGTAAQWTTANPVLASGEIGVELDTEKFKIGDGTSTWTALPYYLNEDATDAKYALKGAGGGTFSGNADDLADGTTKVVMTTTERNKLSGVAAGATANQTDTYLRSRANHTGTQPPSTVDGLSSALADMAQKSGTTRQFTDVSDIVPSEGNIEVWDGDSGGKVPIDPATRFALVDPTTRRLLQSSEPLDFLPAKILETGAPIPPGTRTDTLIFRKPAIVSLSARYIDDTFAQATNTNVLTVTETLPVGTVIGISAMASAETATVPFASATAAYSAGGGTINFATWNIPNTTAGVSNALAAITTEVPANASITLSFRDANGALINRVHTIAILYVLAGVLPSPLDLVVSASGASASNLNSVAFTAQTPTAQPKELAIVSVGWSSLAAPASRVLSDSYGGWTKLKASKSDNGNSGRTLAVFTKVLDTVQNPAFTSQMTSSDANTGQWSAQMTTLKAAS